MRGWQCSCCCQRLWACVCDTASLLPSSIHPSSKNNTPKKLGGALDGWGGVLDLGWQRRSGIPSAPLFPALLTPSGMLPRGPHPHVHVLLGGCSWFSRRLSHSSDPNRPWGQQDVLGLPVGALSVQPGGTAQLLPGTCRAWERGGSVSFKCLGKLSAPAFLPVLAPGVGIGPSHARGAVWCQELALGER